MEFGLDQLRTGVRPGSSRFELSRHVEIARTCSNLVADRFEANINCYKTVLSVIGNGTILYVILPISGLWRKFLYLVPFRSSSGASQPPG